MITGMVARCGGNQRTQTVAYAASAEDFANPERGFTTSRSPFGDEITWDPCGTGDNFTAYDAKAWTLAPSPETLVAHRAGGRSLLSMYYHIAEFRGAPLSADFLAQLDRDFSWARTAGFKIVPRFAYNLYTGGPDAPLSRVLAHLDQLAPILHRNVDVLAFVELGFIGCWGELHSSSNTLVDDASFAPFSVDNAATRAIINKVFEVVPAERMIAVRYPRFEFRYFGNEDFRPIAPLTDADAFDGSIRARWAHHDDCLVCGEWNWGTWWSPPQDAQAVREFLHADNLFVVQVGQPGEPGRPQPPDADGDGYTSNYDSCERVLPIFEQEHWSAIDGGYSPDGMPTAASTWKRDGCLDTISTHLGYRFRMETATLPRVVRRGQPLRLDVVLHNDGWAAPYNERPVEVVLRSRRTGAVTRLPAAGDPRRWQPGMHSLVVETRLPATLRPGRYDVLLALPDAAPSLHDRAEYAIRFANTDTWDAECGCNDLHAVVRVARR
jgi:hypothetical protein